MTDSLKQSHNFGTVTAPVECVWMLAGVVGYKLCDRECDCEHCPFDIALREGVMTGHLAADRTSLKGQDVAGSPFYHPGHVWAHVEDEGLVRVGLDDFGQSLSGRIYSIALPAAGAIVVQDQPCWRITYRAGESDLAAPVAGYVKQLNVKLIKQPSLVNRDPYGECWAMIIEPVHLEQCLKQLYYGQKARATREREVEKLYREVDQLLAEAHASVGATMQDGGALMGGIWWITNRRVEVQRAAREEKLRREREEQEKDKDVRCIDVSESRSRLY